MSVLQKAQEQFEVIVAISINPTKRFIDPKQRYLQVRRALNCAGYKNIPIVLNYGVTAECARRFKCSVLIRGYRNDQD